MDTFGQEIPSNRYNYSRQLQKLNFIADLESPQRVDIKRLLLSYTLNDLHALDEPINYLYKIPRNYGKKRHKDFLIFW